MKNDPAFSYDETVQVGVFFLSRNLDFIIWHMESLWSNL